MTVLIVLEAENGHLSTNARSLAGAAEKIGAYDALVLSSAPKCISEAADLAGCRKVFVLGQDGMAPETVADAIKGMASGYSYILADESFFGRSFIPYLASKLGVNPVSSVIGIRSSDCFTRTVFSASIEETVQCSASPKVISLKAAGFPACGTSEMAAPAQTLEQTFSCIKEVRKLSSNTQGRPSLAEAKIIVAGGRGLDKEGFELLKKLADKLHAGIGATRAAVDAELAPSDAQIGQTGKSVAPDLYVAFGISGAMQHLSGIKNAKIIVAVNSDAEAPIVQWADYALIKDAKETIQSWLDLL